MKKIAFLLAVLMLFTFVGCAAESTDTSSEAAATESSTVADTSSEAPADTSSEATTESSEPAGETSEPADESSEAPAESTVESSEPTEETSDETSDETSEEEEEEEFEEPLYDVLEIGKATTAPKVDGTITDGEYETVYTFDATEEHWGFDSDEDADVYEVELHLSWDENYLYTCVALIVGGPRTYGNTDYLQNRPYIFDRRHVMSAIILGDPTDAKYRPASGDTWDWSAAANSGLGNEWTITAQPDGTNICADHFGKLTQNSEYQYIVGVSELEIEYYEQRIPWSALLNGDTFTPEAGTIIGYAFTACCDEVNLDDESATYACFGAGITGYKLFAHYVGMELVD